MPTNAHRRNLQRAFATLLLFGCRQPDRHSEEPASNAPPPSMQHHANPALVTTVGLAGVNGQVTDADDRPASGVLIVVKCNDLNAIEQMTDGRGHFSLTSLPSGHCTLQALLGPGRYNTSFRLTAGENRSVNVVLNDLKPGVLDSVR